MINKLTFLLSESIKGLFRAKIPALISSMTIAITLIVFTLAYFGYINFIDYSLEFKKPIIRMYTGIHRIEPPHIIEIGIKILFIKFDHP